MSPQTTTTAAEFAAAARKENWHVRLGVRREPRTGKIETGSGIVEVEHRFPPGDTAAYRALESQARTLVGFAHVVSYGSTWGTTSDGVGGAAGLAEGRMTLTKSGIGYRWLRAAGKDLGINVEDGRR